MCSLEKRGNIFFLTITGSGEQRLNPTLLDAIQLSLRRIRAETSAASAANSSSNFVLITTAEGKFFSNGYDLDWALSSPDRPQLMVDRFKSVVSDLIALPMPTIAAVTGHASAAGLILALTHDYVLMRRDRGFLYMSELDIRLVIPPWFMAIIKSKIGAPVARRYVVLKAPKITAEKALEIGIIDSAYDGAEETVAAAVRLGEGLVARKWDGFVYASNRMEMLSEVVEAIRNGGAGSASKL